MVPKADQNAATPAQDPDEMSIDTTASLIVDGCVCPQCFKHLRAPVVTGHPIDRYGPRTRSYAGMCFVCCQACRVFQFEQDGKWLIHRHLVHRYESGQFIAYGDWITVNPLPEPPAVLNGPGGDYDAVPDPANDPFLTAIQGAASGLMQATNAIGQLLKAIEKLRHNGLDNRKH